LGSRQHVDPLLLLLLLLLLQQWRRGSSMLGAVNRPQLSQYDAQAAGNTVEKGCGKRVEKGAEEKCWENNAPGITHHAEQRGMLEHAAFAAERVRGLGFSLVGV
jgi:hypothetical protein